ncbi:MAG: hypothetical protein SOW21_05160 [[Actinobacillus] rossii]|uniref:Lipid A core - O-antigen ligase and related enzymes n=1 Tax=[Actinobacillus] rossii TaxID=123820 RepID=A0A380U156_9PAST|nr:hypothetical protein [[Actinobacillus] rossii]MDY3123759.1 hypothetical protein [[Actinobacillus] rossii]MDY4506215.1 hypothetical protein [[Actinobacillus] rossii]SUT94040.1 Uncharacterised protein [[Actinobacillus] rossii]
MSALVNLFYLYDPWFFHIVRMGMLIGIFTVLWFGYQWYKKLQTKFVIPMDSLIVCLSLVVISVIPILINGTKEFGVISMYVKSFVIFCFGIMIYNTFYLNIENKSQLLRDLNIGISIQAIIGILALFGVSFVVDFSLNTNSMMGGHLPRFIGSEQEYRLYNLTSSAFFPLSAFYLMLLHFILANHAKGQALNAIYLFLLLCIGLISGRTFLIFSAVSILVYFRVRYIPALLAFGLLCLGLAYFYPTHPYVEHALEPLINLFHGNNLSSSTDTLMNKHLFMPELKQLIMGDGLYYQPNGWSYYGGSDSGFIRQALYGGVGYIFICFLFTAYFVKRIADNWFNGSRIYILSTLFLLSVLNIKADTYAYPGLMTTFLMFVSLFGNKGKLKYLERN